MTAQATFSLDAIDATLDAAGPSLEPDEQRLAAAVLRLLSAGELASTAAAAAEPTFGAGYATRRDCLT